MAIIEKSGIANRGISRWVNRDTQETLLQSVGRYTHFVLLSKMFLGVLSTAMILGIIIFPLINADEEGLRIAFSTLKGKTESLPLMTNPKFQGVDDNNQPYMITADSALQHDSTTIILNKMQADIFTQDSAWLSVTADKGTLNTELKKLILSGNVKLYHDQGYEFETEEVHIDMNTNIAYSKTKTEGNGPLGAIVSNGFKWDNNSHVMQFNGGVTLRVARDG